MTSTTLRTIPTVELRSLEPTLERQRNAATPGPYRRRLNAELQAVREEQSRRYEWLAYAHSMD